MHIYKVSIITENMHRRTQTKTGHTFSKRTKTSAREPQRPSARKGFLAAGTRGRLRHTPVSTTRHATYLSAPPPHTKSIYSRCHEKFTVYAEQTHISRAHKPTGWWYPQSTASICAIDSLVNIMQKDRHTFLCFTVCLLRANLYKQRDRAEQQPVDSNGQQHSHSNKLLNESEMCLRNPICCCCCFRLVRALFYCYFSAYNMRNMLAVNSCARNVVN